jgi:hypothetical protein
MLVGARLSGVWHHARAHRFFSHARWSVDQLGLRIAVLIVERLTEPGAPVLVAVDDTLLHRPRRRRRIPRTRPTWPGSFINGRAPGWPGRGNVRLSRENAGY